MTISADRKKAILSARSEMYRDDTTPPIEKIAGLFPRGYISIMASMPGAGKTWLMQYIACQLSIGGKILGGIVAKSKKYKCLIFAGETNKRMLDQRLALTNWQHEPKNMIVYEAISWARNEVPYMLNTKDGQETIAAVVEAERPAIVWFDTFLSFHTADESKMADMNNVVQFLLRMAHYYNLAIVLNHHTRKRANSNNGEKRKYTQDDVIGSSSTIRLANAVFIISTDELEAGQSLQTVTNVKSWDEKTPPFTFKFTRDDDGYTDLELGFDTGGKNIFWSIRERLQEYIKSMASGALITIPDAASFIGISKELIRTYLDDFSTGKNFMSRTKLLERTNIMGNVAYRVL